MGRLEDRENQNDKDNQYISIDDMVNYRGGWSKLRVRFKLSEILSAAKPTSDAGPGDHPETRAAADGDNS